MGQVRNDFGEVRVLPSADYAGVEPGRVLEIPDENVYHWVAGGWTPLTRYPVPHRLYANHSGDGLAYALPEPDAEDPSAIAVGEPVDAVEQRQVDAAPTTAAASSTAQNPAATAPTAAPTPAPAGPAQAAAETKEQQA